MPMENKILIYRLSERQNEILVEAFPNEKVMDVTDCFTDLIAIPAVAVVLNPDALTDAETVSFNEVF